MKSTSQQTDNSRVSYVKKNMMFSIIYQVSNIVLKFVFRTIFIYTLGKNYLGISGVFANILTVLSLSELGLGSAIIYDMYEPIANKEYKQVNNLMGLYKRLYSWIGIFILAAGCLLTPFLKYIISDVPDVKYLEIIYILHVIHTASSYFFAQYRSLLAAHQMNYINTVNTMIFNILKVIIEAIVLVVFHNYILYMAVEISVQFLSNFQILHKCKKQFPYLNKKAEKIEREKLKKIAANAMSSFNIRLGITIVNATDNIVISAMIGVSVVGLYSNYSMIISVITATTMMISSSAQASVGNLCTEKNNRSKQLIFNKLQFVYCMIYGLCFVGIIYVLNPFMLLWLGDEFVLPVETVCLIGISCWLTGIRQPLEMYVYADGLFPYYKYKPWIEAAINLTVSVVLADKIGLNGVFIGTIMSNLLTSFWYEPYVVFRKSFDMQVRLYYVKLLQYLFVTVLCALLCGFLFRGIMIDGVFQNFIFRLIICCTVFGIFTVVLLGRSGEFQYYFNMVRGGKKK